MRRWPLDLGLVLIAALTALDLYLVLAPEAEIYCFAWQPARLVYVALLGGAGGIVALVISRLPAAARRILKLATLAGMGALLTCELGFCACFLPHVASAGREGRFLGPPAAAVLSLLVVTAMVWLEFGRVWRKS